MSKKSKTMKKKSNKKILKKMVNNSILEENIRILIGGERETEKTKQKNKSGGNNTNFTEPSEFDKFLGYNSPVDTRSPLDSLNDYIKNSLGSIVNITSGLIAHKVSDTIGMEGKTPEEIGEILKKDSEKLEKINDYLKTNEGEKMLDEVKELTTTVSDVIGESVQKIPDDLDETIDKLAENAVNAGVGAMTDIPGVNVVVGTSKMVSSLQGVAGETAEAVGKVANLVGDTAEKIKEPINNIKDKIDEISDKIESVENFSPDIPQPSETQQREMPQTSETQQHEMPQPSETQQREMPQTSETQQHEMPQTSETQQREIPQTSETQQREIPQTSETQQREIPQTIQLGGHNINNIRNIQTGGKKIKKRVNNTRYAFKNLIKNITKKNK